LQPDATAARRYVAVGHVTVDVLADGERRPGGTALYSALQAARLGLAATIVTRGVASELERMLAPFAAELELIVQPAAATTTLGTTGAGEQRRQRMLSWAGPVALDALPAGEILHLAPVAAELSGVAHGDWPFVGLTPQGLARAWDEPGGEITACSPEPSALRIAGHCDAVVLSEQERASCAALIERALATGATVAVTAGPGATEMLLAGGEVCELPVEPVAAPLDDLGAGDVYAAALFVGLAAGEDALTAAGAASAAAALRMHGVGPGAIAGAQAIAARVGAARPQGA
jgi:sugar/nucleoside kinase (ribokinase family)